MKNLFLTLFLILPLYLFSQTCDDLKTTYTGDGTFYGYSGGGNCSYPNPSSPVYTGAMNAAQYNNAASCGACVEVTGERGTLLISIEDQCPECKFGDIDLSIDAFPMVADPIKGRVTINWKYVACPYTTPIQFYFKEGSSKYWTAVQVRNSLYPISKVEYKKNGTYKNLQKMPYNYYLDEQGFGTDGPYDFRITDMFVNVTEETAIPFLVTTVINGKTQFSNCNTLTSVNYPETESFNLNHIAKNKFVYKNDNSTTIEIRIFNILGEIIDDYKINENSELEFEINNPGLNIIDISNNIFHLKKKIVIN